MTIQEQITALLNGDMTDEGHVAELMHVLAVSPEKRALLVEQVAMSRAFTAMGTGVVPPASADLNILKGIAAIDAGLAINTPADAPAPPQAARAKAPAEDAKSRMGMLAPILGVLCLALGLGAGYLLWGEDSRPAPQALAAQSTAAATVDRSAALRDSLALLRSQLLTLGSDHESALRQIDALKNRPARVVYRDRVITQRHEEAPQAESQESSIPAATLDTTAPSLNSAELRHALPEQSDMPARDLAASSSSTTIPVIDDAAGSDEEKGEGAWQVGLRDNFRLSLPRVYGLAGNRSILFDKEVVATYRMGAGAEGLLSSFRLGLTAGETQFSQIFHTNTGGVPIDTIIEQSPTLQYLRFLLAPELVRTAQVTGSLELGAGSTMHRFRIVAPLATVGVNLEYRPVDLLSIHAGGSTWLMWTEFRNQIYVSTNLNAHLGFAVGF